MPVLQIVDKATNCTDSSVVQFSPQSIHDDRDPSFRTSLRELMMYPELDFTLDDTSSLGTKLESVVIRLVDVGGYTMYPRVCTSHHIVWKWCLR